MTIVLLLIALANAGLVGVIVGDATARANQVLAQADAAGARTITVRATGNSGEVTPTTAKRLVNLRSVEGVVAVSRLLTATNGQFREDRATIPAFRIFPLSGGAPVVPDDPERPATSGEALLSHDAARALRMDRGIGSLNVEGNSSVPAVGTFSSPANADLSQLLRTAAIVAADPKDYEDIPIEVISIRLRSAADAPAVARVIGRVLGVPDPDRISVHYPVELVAAQKASEGTLRSGLRVTAVSVVLGGAALVCLAALGNAASQRRDIARRRALGATRSVVAGLITAEVALVAAVGSVMGSVAVSMWMAARYGSPNVGFALAVAWFVTSTSSLAAAPGAVLAALRDPAETLRVP